MIKEGKSSNNVGLYLHFLWFTMSREQGELHFVGAIPLCINIPNHTAQMCYPLVLSGTMYWSLMTMTEERVVLPSTCLSIPIERSVDGWVSSIETVVAQPDVSYMILPLLHHLVDESRAVIEITLLLAKYTFLRLAFNHHGSNVSVLFWSSISWLFHMLLLERAVRLLHSSSV